MGDYNSSAITKKGIALMSKTLAGAHCQFTRAAASENRIGLDVDLTDITQLEGSQQSVDLLSIKPINGKAVKIEALFENGSLERGYYVETIGLYAQDPDEGEILYSVTTAKKAEWLPEWNGMSTSSLTFNLIVTVSNASNVSILINPDSLADLTKRVEILEDGHVYHDERITVLEQNQGDIYTRLDALDDSILLKDKLLSSMERVFRAIAIRKEDFLVQIHLYRFGFLIKGLMRVSDMLAPNSLPDNPPKDARGLHIHNALHDQKWAHLLGERFQLEEVVGSDIRRTDGWEMGYTLCNDYIAVSISGSGREYKGGLAWVDSFTTYASDAWQMHRFKYEHAEEIITEDS